MATKQKFYAVKKGFQTGIFLTWDECKQHTQGFKGALFKSFKTRLEAENYLNNQTSTKQDEKQDDRYYIYVDGSYFDGKYSWGMAIYQQGKLIDTFSGVGKSADASQLHNVAGEIEGAIQATKWAIANDEPIIICHDYIGLSQWALGNWKTNTKLTAQYAQFMKQNLKLITFKKVAGHTGVEGNELADKLAKQALGL